MPSTTHTHPIDIVIADDSDLLRNRLRNLLEPDPDMQVVGEAATADDAVQLVHAHKPKAVVLDIQMPGNGINALKQIKATYPGVKVIMFTNHADSYFRRVSMRAGADAFLDKSLEFEAVAATISQIAKNGESHTS